MNSNKSILVVKNIVHSTMSNADAMPLKVSIDAVIKKGDIAVLSFEDIHTLTSSFLNSSLGEIVDTYGFDSLNGKLSIINYTPTIGQVIKRYLDNVRATI